MVEERAGMHFEGLDEISSLALRGEVGNALSVALSHKHEFPPGTHRAIVWRLAASGKEGVQAAHEYVRSLKDVDETKLPGDALYEVITAFADAADGKVPDSELRRLVLNLAHTHVDRLPPEAIPRFVSLVRAESELPELTPDRPNVVLEHVLHHLAIGKYVTVETLLRKYGNVLSDAHKEIIRQTIDRHLSPLQRIRKLL